MREVPASRLPKRPGSSSLWTDRLLRRSAVQALLSPLEAASRSRPIPSDGTEVVEVPSLDRDVLAALFANRLLAVRVPGYCDAALCDTIAANVLRQAATNWRVLDVNQGYRNSDVDVIGRPFNMAAADDEQWRHYFETLAETTLRIRGLAGDALHPLDRFRLELDERWPPGLTVARHDGAKLMPGLVRVMREMATAAADIPLNCHVDTSPVLSPRHGQFSVNIYLKPADAGGELFVWNTRLSSTLDLLRHWYDTRNFFLQSSYADEAIQRRFQQRLPAPRRIVAGKGDLVLLNTGRPHAVAPFAGGPRVSMQAFLDYRRGEPIGIWA